MKKLPHNVIVSRGKIMTFVGSGCYLLDHRSSNTGCYMLLYIKFYQHTQSCSFISLLSMGCLLTTRVELSSFNKFHIKYPLFGLCRNTNTHSSLSLWQIILSPRLTEWTSLVAQRLKRLPPMRETRVQSLGREDPLEKKTAIHSSILAWRIPWTEKPSSLQFTRSQRVGHE